MSPDTGGSHIPPIADGRLRDGRGLVGTRHLRSISAWSEAHTGSVAVCATQLNGLAETAADHLTLGSVSSGHGRK